MSFYKKLLIIASALVLMLATGCSAGGGVTQVPSLPPVTVPEIPEGVISDEVQGRFDVNGNNIYYAVSDSILCYNGSVELVVTADAPSHICILEGKVFFRSVSARVDFKPVEYQLQSVDLSSGEITTYASGNINQVVKSGGKIFYISDYTKLFNLDNGSVNELVNAELSEMYACGGFIYLGINGDLCKYDANGGEYVPLLSGCFPNNITADENNVYFSTETDNALQTLDVNSGNLTRSQINNFGLVLNNGVHYYVVNDEGFALVNAGDKSIVAELGKLQNCSAPLFYNGDIYFFISSDDYFGLIKVSSDGSIIKLTEAEG